jgi:basic membrane protein A
MKPEGYLFPILAFLALLLFLSGCSQPALPEVPSVYIVYGSEKGDLSYTDAAYQGILMAQKDRTIQTREFVPGDFETVPSILNNSNRSERPDLVITVGFQYANFTRHLADDYPDIHFLAIDQSGIGSDNVRSYEITSYGDSYLAGVLAATASKNGRIGIIQGMQSEVLDTFHDGYQDGARAVNSTIRIDQAYVRQYSTEGFMDPGQAGLIAEGMYHNGTDVIFTCAGYSNTGAFAAARNGTGRYIIGTDSDQSPLGPDFILASAVKRVDHIVYAGISSQENGTFTGGNVTAGLREDATGIVFNPKFADFNTTVHAWGERAQQEEARYLSSRTQSNQK